MYDTDYNPRQVEKLVGLIKTSRTIMSNFAKAKTAKIGKTTLDPLGKGV